MRIMIPAFARIFVVAAILGASFGAAILVSAWTGPSASPPGSNVSAPISVSSTNQVKSGGLSVGGVGGGFSVYASAYIQDRLGIADASPEYPLDVTGDIHNTGNVYSAGYFHNSDARLKSDVAKSAGLSIIEKLRGVTFRWKEGGAPGAGVIAQEVEEVMPSAVHTDADGMKTVEYDQLIAPLIEAIHEQQAEIDSLKHEVETLKAGN